MKNVQSNLHYRKILLSRQRVSFGTSMITTIQQLTISHRISKHPEPARSQYTVHYGRRRYREDLTIPRTEDNKRRRKVHNINLHEKRHHQCTSKTSLWTWSQDTQGYLHWFPSQSILHLSINPTWKKKWTSWSDFSENGYNNNEVKKIAKMYHQKMTSAPNNMNWQEDDTLNATVTLPWIPGLSPKLRKSFRKQDIKTVFKSCMICKYN